jgi:hypothetical protein
MHGGEYDFDQACRAGNPAEYAAHLLDDELAALCRHAEGIMRQNEGNGGIPATIKWVCVLEGAKRFFQQTQESKTQDTRRES